MTETDLLARSNLELLREELPDRYQELEPLAQGGQGAIFRARDTKTGLQVAVKMLPPSQLGNHPLDVKKRFLREVKAIERLSHPYIVKVIEVGPGKRLPFFVMELVQGETLGAYLTRIRQVDVQRHLRITLDICDALAHAHAKAVVHRDLKPDNIILLPDGSVKVLDFGLAKTFDATTLTRSGQVMGTPVYMAPEQLQGTAVDRRADIYALGVILYQLLTLTLPYPSDAFYSKVYRVPDPPCQKNPAISPMLEAVVLRSLSIEPDRRPASCEDLKWELSACLKDYVEFSDVPLMGENWKDLLKSDLERLSVEAHRVRERVQLVPGEVRDVTLLVLRMPGMQVSREFMEREGLRFVADRSHFILANEIERYGGEVDRYLPGALIAHFGSRSASEADCERAVRAGLGIFEKAQALNGMLGSRGISMEVGVGVDVARITVGAEEPVDESAFPIMEVPDERLLGGLWVTMAARQRLSSGFQLTLPAPEQSGIALSRVDGVASRADILVRRERFRRVPFIGRELERRDFDALFKEACQLVNPGPAATMGRRTKPTLVTVSGEPGIGKSRLVREFLNARGQEAGITPLEGQPVSFLKSPFLVVTSMLRTWLGLSESSPPDAVRASLAIKLEEVGRLSKLRGPLPASTPTLLGYLLGLVADVKNADQSAANVLQNQILSAVTDLILRMSFVSQHRDGRPLVLVYEDLQWADDLSIGVLETTLTTASAGLFVLATYRPPYETPERWKRFAGYHAFMLSPLRPPESCQLVTDLLGGRQPSERLVDLVVRRSSGNPFFIEETVNLLVDDGALAPREQGWELVKDEDALTVPTTVNALILSRFDLLPAPEKEVLQLCATIGTEVDGAILEEMARELWGDQRDLRGILERLRAMNFLLTSQTGGQSTYAFRHALAREVVYSTLLSANRRVLHGLAARAIERVYAATIEELSPLLAYHCNRSDEPSRALQYTEIALRKAVAKYDHAGTLKLADEAARLLSMTGDDPAKWFDVLSMRERGYEVLGLRNEQFRDLTRMGELARALDDERRLSDVQNRLSWFHWWNIGDYAKARTLAVEALESKRRLKDKLGEAHALRNLGCVHTLLGDYEESARHHRRAQRLFSECGDTIGVAGSTCSLAINAWQDGKIAEALELAVEALDLDRTTGDRRSLGRDLRTLGDLHATVGSDEQALEYYAQALGNDRDIGYRQGEAANLACSGKVLLNQGRAMEALTRFKEGLEVAISINARPLVGEIFLGMAVAYRENTQSPGWEVSRICAQNAHDLGEELGTAGLITMGLTSLALAELRLERPDEALRLSTRAVSYLKGGKLAGVRTEEIWYNHAQVLQALGRSADAREALDRARGLVEARASRLNNDALADGFLSRVTLNRRIREHAAILP